MGRRLRIFISSTMEDLADPRDAICQRLLAYNFEPVNAEAFLPRGGTSWETIQGEIASSDVFVLLSGDSYGWPPDDGYGADSGKSVTELEYEEAERLGLPIIAFFKRLPYGATSDPERDAFRRRVQDWGKGRFRGEFSLARDLADKVGMATLELLQDHFFKTQRETSGLGDGGPANELRHSEVVIPPALVRAVAARDVTLWVGAGVSLSAGLPAARAFTDKLVAGLQAGDRFYRPPGAGTLFNAVATDFESARSFEELHDAVRELLGATWARPTDSHLAAIRSFDHILTTNYDLLLEQAMGQLGDARQVLVHEPTNSTVPPRFLAKLHGSINSSAELVLTENQLAAVEQTRPHLWEAARETLRAKPVLIVGTSLRDPSIIELFESIREDVRGWIVMQYPSEIERRRLERWNLEPIVGDLETFFRKLD